jgi:hypothetical protein
MSGHVLLDPTGEREAAQRQNAARLGALSSARIGLLDISKSRGDVFLDRLEAKLVESGATVARFRKPTFTKPAPLDLRQQIAERCDAVIEALAD